MTAEATIGHVGVLDLVFEPTPWRFAQDRCRDIDAHFEQMRGDNSQLWNGQVLVMRRQQVVNGVLHGALSKTDYASFLTWRLWGSRQQRRGVVLARLRYSAPTAAVCSASWLLTRRTRGWFIFRAACRIPTASSTVTSCSITASRGNSKKKPGST
jgi:hypothetical protein